MDGFGPEVCELQYCRCLLNHYHISNGLLVYQLAGQPANYTIQASADMSNWTNIAILANTTGMVNFVDQNSTNYPSRFYRALVQ